MTDNHRMTLWFSLRTLAKPSRLKMFPANYQYITNKTNF